MTIQVNGAPRELAPGATVTSLLGELELGAGWVVVEHNGQALLRSTFDATVLTDGDVLEIVRAVAGG